MGIDRYFAVTADGELRLDQPTGLEGAAWCAINDSLARLNRAIASDDLPLVVGTCKDLAEAVAKVVVTARGDTVGSNVAFPSLMAKAQAALDRQPGKGLAADAAIRLAAQSALTQINALPDLRNRVGTGHGRSLLPAVAEEIVLVSVDMTMLWCRWALRRLEHVIFGRPDHLIRHLTTGGTFYRGDLAARLHAAHLASLDPPDLRALATAVAHRALSGTFLVRDEGVAACAESGDLSQWPDAYRVGLINALMVNAEGQIDTTPWAVRQIRALLDTVEHPETVLDELHGNCAFAMLAPRLDSDQAKTEVDDAMRALERRMSYSLVRKWRKIAEEIVPPPF